MTYQNGKTFFACGQPVVVRLANGETHIFSTDGERLSTEDMSFGTLYGGVEAFRSLWDRAICRLYTAAVSVTRSKTLISP